MFFIIIQKFFVKQTICLSYNLCMVLNFFKKKKANTEEAELYCSNLLSEIVKLMIGDNAKVCKLSEFFKNNLCEIDLVKNDLELKDIKKLEDKIQDIKIFQTQVTYHREIKKFIQFDEILEYMRSKGFNQKGFKFIGNIEEEEDGTYANAIFVNTKYLGITDVKKLENITTKPRIFANIKKLIASGDIDFYEYFNEPRYDISIDVVIPTTTKDFKILKLAIESIKKNVLHTVKDIYVVSHKGKLEDFCKKEGYKFVDENTVLPITIKDINYCPNGLHREGWIFQQLLKLNSDKITDSKYILISDSDTVYTKPQSFFNGDKILFDCSDEYSQAYFEAYKKLIKLDKRFYASFVAHHMMFEREMLKELKKYIEKQNGKKWYEAILDSLDYNEISSFSEYEMYANYMYFKHPEKVFLRYWFNKRIRYRYLKKILKNPKLITHYKAISIHTYK